MAPSIGNGLFFIDCLEYQKNIKWDRMSDAQFDLVQSPIIPDFKGFRKFGDINIVKKATTEEKTAADVITNRLENWYLASGKQTSSPEFILRKEAIDRQIKYALTHNTADLNLSVAVDGTISGAGLFPDYFPATIGDTKIRKFKDIMTGCMLPLAYDYRMNKNKLSKTRMLNILDWFNDQGWADGSALGGLNFEKLRSAGYFHSLFLMRNELDTVRLNRELNTLNWFGKVGLTNKPFESKGENADDIRALVIAKLTYALMQPNKDKRAAALTSLTKYLNNSFAIAPGYWETFKPDYSGYHHINPYFSAYYPEALYMACLTYYLLHDTPYALSESVYTTLKNCLLTFRLTASIYNVPIALSGRFPTSGPTLSQNIAAFAYLALSKNEPDTELLAAFGRLWKPTIFPLKDELAKASTEICLRTTLGETELCLQAASLRVPAEKSPKTTLFLPYSGLMINRNSTFHVTLRGFSKYLWDYEGESGRPDLNGRYLSYGQLEFTDLTTGRRNNNYSCPEWNWSRIPGTTTIQLSPTELLYNSNVPNRNFSDKSFLGGVTLNDSTSLFSMQLHDITFNKTFYANKSVFCFGNVLLCLGSNISNNDKNLRTETTLFQLKVFSGEKVKVNGKTLDENQSEISNPLLHDNMGTRYIVKSGSVDIQINDSLTSAVINHGLAPDNKDYTYFMILQGNDGQEKLYSNPKKCPVTIIQQDAVAHIACKRDNKVWGYAIFDATKPLTDKWIEKVNYPSIVMLKVLDDSKISLVVTDPDMHRPSTTGMNKMNREMELAPSRPFNYEITLNGRFELYGNNPAVVVTNTEKTTKLSLTVVDGKCYSIGLKNLIAN
jgi:chondroitin-sulfate-ABC endolyase/exolyase